MHPDEFEAFARTPEYLVLMAVAECFLQLHVAFELGTTQTPHLSFRDSMDRGMESVLASSLAVHHSEHVKRLAEDYVEFLLARFEGLREQYENQTPFTSPGEILPH